MIKVTNNISSAVYKFFLIRYRNTLLTIQIDGSHGEY